MRIIKKKDFKSKIYYISDVAYRVGKDRVTILKWCREGKFPPSRRINGLHAWPADEIDQWLEDNKK